MFVFSPSNLAQYRTCPLRFAGQSIWKDIKWKASAQKTRGTLVHEALEAAVRDGKDDMPDGIDQYFTRRCVQQLRDAVADGGQVFVEYSMCVNQKLEPVDWWASDAFVRAKADAVLFHGDGTTATVIDWKTGKKWDEDAFQLRLETLLILAVHKRPIVNYAFHYVDQGESVRGMVDYRNGIGPVKDITALMKEAKVAIRDGYFPPKRNRFCNWCDYHNTPKCNV